MRALSDLPQTVLPGSVQTLIAQIVEAGFEAWIVGGAVRDLVWERPIHDWDVATDAPLIHLQQWYGDDHPGLRYGSFRIKPGLQLTILRRDLGVGDGRHPMAIESVATIGEDLQRRDFTVNAVAFNHGGVWAHPLAETDLRERRWRAVGNPWRRFQEDGLRIVRLGRFWALYGGIVDEATAKAARRGNSEGGTVGRPARLAELKRTIWAPRSRWDGLAHLGWYRALELPSDRHGWFREWPEPDGEMARLLLFLVEAWGDWKKVREWIAVWPFARAQRRDLLGAIAGLGPSPDPEVWVAYAQRRAPGARILTDWARAAGWPI